MSAPSPPSESLLDASGQMRTTWRLYFNQQSAYIKANNPGAAQSAADAAQSTATAASTSASSALAQLATINSSPQLWLAGDYKQSANNLGSGWLKCDGTMFSGATYPALATALGTTTLPSIAPVFDDAHPGPDGPPVVQWWIRAY